MTTVLDIVNRAFRKLGIKAEDENLTPDQIANGLDVLNDMMAAWPKRGIDIPTGFPLVSSDDFPMDAWANEPTIYCLAARLAPDYGVAGVDATDHEKTLRNYFILRDGMEFPKALINTYSRRWR